MGVRINVQINVQIKTSSFDGITGILDGKDIIRSDAIRSTGIRIWDRIEAKNMLNS